MSDSGKRATAVPKLVGQHRTLPGGRTYWLDGTGPDLVIGLPGMALGAANVNDTFWLTGNPATTGWQRHAETNGYTLALGEALAGNWNVGGGWDGGTQDDMAYLLAIVDDVTTVRGAPPAHVFVAGFSVGGAMAWDACALHPEVFEACGEAAGWAPVPAVKPVDVWHVHGTADTTVPVRGGCGLSSGWSVGARGQDIGVRAVIVLGERRAGVAGLVGDRASADLAAHDRQLPHRDGVAGRTRVRHLHR